MSYDKLFDLSISLINWCDNTSLNIHVENLYNKNVYFFDKTIKMYINWILEN